MKRSILLILLIPVASGARSPETIYATYVQSPPRRDGIIELGEYPAQPATGFLQHIPNPGDPAQNDTEVYIVYDETALYFGIICHDRNTAGLIANNVSRDAYIQSDDTIKIMIDANNDGDSAYDLMVNCRGTMYDGLFSADGSSGGREWDGVWSVETSIGENRWTCEIVLPWVNMVYDVKTTEMGIQFLRYQQGDHETTFWAGDGFNTNRVSTFGTLAGLEGLSLPKRFTIIPYGTIYSEQWPSETLPDLYEDETTGDGGVDFGYDGGKSFQFNATFNPDYAQIEADPNVINLTPGIVYLTEKRPFFTETNTAFDMYRINPLYTRRMTDIFAGAKATGTVGKVNYAALDVQLGNDDVQFPDDNVSAVRLKANISGASYIGGGFVFRKGYGEVSRSRDLSHSNIVGLIDGSLALPANFSLKGAIAKSQTDWFSAAVPGETGHDWAGVLQLNYVVPGSAALIRYKEFGERFQSDVSAYEPYDLNRREGFIYGDKTFHIDKPIIRDLTLTGMYMHRRRLDNDASIFNYLETYIDIYSNNFIIEPYMSRGYDETYYMYGLPRYVIDRYGLYLATEAMTWGSASVFFWRGEFYGARYNDTEIELTAIPHPMLEINLTTEFIDPIYDTNEPEHNTAADNLQIVANLKVTHNILDNLYWRAILQGDNEDDMYLGSFLVGWEYLPGSNAYLAYEENRLNNFVTEELELVDRRLFLKASYMLTL